MCPPGPEREFCGRRGRTHVSLTPTISFHQLRTADESACYICKARLRGLLSPRLCLIASIVSAQVVRVGGLRMGSTRFQPRCGVRQMNKLESMTHGSAPTHLMRQYCPLWVPLNSPVGQRRRQRRHRTLQRPLPRHALRFRERDRTLQWLHRPHPRLAHRCGEL